MGGKVILHKEDQAQLFCKKAWLNFTTYMKDGHYIKVSIKMCTHSSPVGRNRSWPPLAGIILSHDHYDHLDHSVMVQLKDKNIPFYCSLGVGDILEKWGIKRERITEMDWGGTIGLCPVSSSCKTTPSE